MQAGKSIGEHIGLSLDTKETWIPLVQHDKLILNKDINKKELFEPVNNFHLTNLLTT